MQNYKKMLSIRNETVSDNYIVQIEPTDQQKTN